MTRDALRDGLRDGLRDVPHTTPHHTTSKNTSSRGMALALETEGRDELAADLARLVCSLRPDWAWTATRDAIRRDDRPWRTIVLGSIRGATDPGIRHPNGLRYVNPNGTETTPIPPSLTQLRTVARCQHGGESGLCALCRGGVA